MKRFITLVFVILLFIIAIVIGLKNQQAVNINYLVAQSEMRLSTLLAINFLLGFLASTGFAIFFYLRLGMKNRQLRKEIKKQNKDLSKLRNAAEQITP